MVPPAGRGGSSPCSPPADVYLSGEWGRMGYGLPLGLDGGQAGIGALVTVATLKTSEGSGKTQTQCLFLRTEKGSYLYSTAKPGSGVSAGAASSVVGGWLRGKTRSRDAPGGTGRRDNNNGATNPQAQTGANRVRVRSGRRWRKSCNAAAREKTGVSRELRGSGKEGEIILEERQEEGDKGEFSSRCSQRAETNDEKEGAESPRGGEVKGMRRERQENEEEEEEPNSDLESNHNNPDGEDVREAEENNSEGMKTENNDSLHGGSCEVTEDFSSRHIRDKDHRKEEEEGDMCVTRENQEEKTHVSVSTCPPPVGGSTCNPEQQTRVWWEKENKNEEEENTVNEPQEGDASGAERRDGKEEEEEETWRDRFSKEDDDDEGGRRLQESGDTCGRSSITESEANVLNVDPSTSINTLLLANPAPSLPPFGSMATGLPCLEAEKEKEEEEVEREGVNVTVEDGEGIQEGKRELEEPGEEERGSTVATEEGRKEEEEEEDEFGVFMQAEGEPAWSEGSSMSASVPCGSRGSVGECPA